MFIHMFRVQFSKVNITIFSAFNRLARCEVVNANHLNQLQYFSRAVLEREKQKKFRPMCWTLISKWAISHMLLVQLLIPRFFLENLSEKLDLIHIIICCG